MRGIYILTTIALSALAGCNKLSTVKHFTLDPGVKAYFHYKSGSQWNYVLESDTSITETTTVANYREGRMVWDAFDQEFMEYDLISSSDSLEKLRAIADDNNVSRVALLMQDTAFKQALQWNFAGGMFSAISGTNDTLFVHASMNVRGNVYQSVIEIRPAKKKLLRSACFARNIGIIRKQMGDGRVFLLKSYSLQ